MTTDQRAMIEAHGRQLLAIFPTATERNPVSLCRKLRRLEKEAAVIGLRMCNGPEYLEGEDDAACESVLAKVHKVLGIDGPAIFVNRDPRGYALKISDRTMMERGYQLHKDWGGYGIIAPEF